MSTDSKETEISAGGTSGANSAPAAPHEIRAWMYRLGRRIGGLLILSAVFLLGLYWGGAGTDRRDDQGAPAGVAAQGSLWTCSMHPQIRQPKPGLCPICGMELVPVQSAEEPAPAKKVKYACSMMCVPPMDRPGKCPVCGMDMVPVEEYGAEEPAGTPGGENALSDIKLSETARKLARLQVSPVERRFVAAEIRMVGKVEFDETRQRSISSRVPGRLDRLFVDYTGVRVQKGDHLVSLYSPELVTAQEELLQAARGVKESDPIGIPALKEAALQSLAASRGKLLLWGLTQEQLDEIENRGTASDHLTIYAPMGGIVTEKRLVEGAYVEEGTEIYTIADLSRVWVKLDAYELDLPWLRYGQEVEFLTEAYSGERFHGRIAFIDPVLNERTRTSKVRVNVPNPDGQLKPGMFVRATVQSQVTSEGTVLDPALGGKWICPMHPEVVADGPESCTQCGMPLVPAESLGYASQSPSQRQPPLVIPVTAPLITGKRAVVYVSDPDRPERYEGRQVLLGPRAGDSYLVHEGLTEGEMVVSQGNIYLDSAVQILAKRSMMQPEPGGMPPGHAHGGAQGNEARKQQGKDTAHVRPTGHVELAEPAREALNLAYDAYFALHHTLSRDQHATTKDLAKQLLNAADAIDKPSFPGGSGAEWRSLYASLSASAKGVSEAKNIESARAAFEGVSNAMIAVARQFGTGRRPQLRIYHCPMAFDNRGAYWMQDKEGLENPYFGSEMFTCGVWKESIEGASNVGHDGGGK